MSDRRARQLERRWRETGSVEDQAAYLLERVRGGEIDRRRLDLVVYCGLIPRALVGLPDDYEPDFGQAERARLGWPVADLRSLREWVVGLDHWGVSVVARAAIAAVDYLSRVVPRREALCAEVLTSAQAWLVCAEDPPTSSAATRHATALRDAVRQLDALKATADPLAAIEEAPFPTEEQFLAAGILHIVGANTRQAVSDFEAVTNSSAETLRAVTFKNPAVAQAVFSRTLRREATYRQCEDAVRNVIARALTDWIANSSPQVASASQTEARNS